MSLATTLEVVFAAVMATLPCLPAKEIYTLEKDGENINFMLLKRIIPYHYKVQLTPYLVEGNFTFYGEIDVSMRVVEATNDIVLHAKNLIIDEQMTTLTSLSGNVGRPMEHRYDYVFDLLTLSFEQPLTLDVIYRLEIKFTGEIGTDPNGLRRSFRSNEHGDTVWMASTPLFPLSARCVFPCWDEPAFKAQFDIVIKHYPNYTALSNMPMKEESPLDKDGLLWSIFETTPFMSTNVVTFALVDFYPVSNNKKNGMFRMWCTEVMMPYISFALELLENATRIMEAYTKIPIAIPKMDYVVIPDQSSIVIQHWGLALYSYKTIVYDFDTRSVKEKNGMTMIHETSRMWFGDLVTPSSWQYLWMTEGFATYFKYIVANDLFPAWRVLDTYGVREMPYIFEMDIPPTTTRVNRNIIDPNHLLMDQDPCVTCHKAGAFLRMTAHTVPEKVFTRGIVEYLSKNANDSVTPDKFSDALQKALDESDVSHDRFKFKEFLDTWINQAGYPLVNAVRDYSTGQINLTQEVFVPSRIIAGGTDISAKWWIPISYATQTNIEFRQTSPKVWMKPHENVTKIEGVDVEDWIVLNVQITGLYRVNYDETNWKRIAKYLNSDSYADIHVINRINLINDAFTLLLIRRIDPDIFFRLLSYLEREIDPVPWELGTKILQCMYPHFMVPEQAEIFRPRISRLFDKIVERVGFEEKADEDHTINTLRSRILEVACQYGHDACKRTAIENMTSYLEVPQTYEEISEEKKWVVCMALLEAGNVAWQNLLQFYRNHTSERTLMYLSCTNKANLFENFLELLIEEDSPILKEHFMEKVESVLYLHPANIDIFLNYCVKNKDKLKDIIKTDELLRLAKTKDRFVKVTRNFPLNLTEWAGVLASAQTQVDVWESAVAEIRDWIVNGDQS